MSSLGERLLNALRESSLGFSTLCDFSGQPPEFQAAYQMLAETLAKTLVESTAGDKAGNTQEASTAIDALGLMYEESGDAKLATGLFKAHAILVADDPKAEFLEEAGTWADTLEGRGKA